MHVLSKSFDVPCLILTLLVILSFETGEESASLFGILTLGRDGRVDSGVVKGCESIEQGAGSRFEGCGDRQRA